jgi:hypothetical protein
MKDIRYIKETQEFIIDGKVVKEATLTENEIRILKSKCKQNTLLIGSKTPTGKLII